MATTINVETKTNFNFRTLIFINLDNFSLTEYMQQLNKLVL